MKFCDERIQKHLLAGGKIKRVSSNKDWSYRPILLDDYFLIFADNGDDYNITKQDLTADDWEIVEPEYDWDKIIKDKVLCVFGYNQQEQYYIVGYLEKIESDGRFKLLDGMSYNHCKPFNPAEFNITKDLKEYEK